MSGIDQFKVRGGTKIADFLTSNRPVDILCGPLGSGKTKALCVRVMRHAQEQAKSPRDGLRHTRFAMVRNTSPDLRRTTMRSWVELYPEHIYGRLKMAPPMGHIWSFGDVRCEIDFIGLDKDEDIRKLRSTEYTGVFFDELEFIEKIIVDEARSRLRFPPEDHGGPTWCGVCAATNAPPEDHWLPIMTGQVEFPPGLSDEEIASLKWPEEWGYHQQPAALVEETDQYGNVTGYKVNPKAENLGNLRKGYYESMLATQSKAWIDSRLMVRTVLVAEGSPVWPSFKREVYVSRETLRPRPDYPVWIGLDFGRSPAAVFVQQINNRMLVMNELIGSAEGAERFAPKVKRFLAQHYPGFEVHAYGDPKGADKTQSDERTAYDIFRENGIMVRSPPGLKLNMIETRVNAVDHVLCEMTDGRPRFCVSPACRTLVVAMAGRYCNERDERGELIPIKNRYSHICDALQYVVLGMGEGRAMIGLKPLSDLNRVQTWKRNKSMRRIEA